MKQIMILLPLLLAACNFPTIQTAIAPTFTPSSTIDTFQITKEAGQTQNAAVMETYAAKLTATKTAELGKPTETKAPTKTPTQVPTKTPLPDPVILTGSGDDVVDFENPFDVAIAHITGNNESENFAVWSYDSNGNKIDLLVNTIDPYDGIVPLDFGDKKTTRFEIKSSGDWTIEVKGLWLAHELDVPGKIEGNGDDVFVIYNGKPDLAIIRGNEQSKNFAVRSVGIGTYDLLVNTIDPYEGTVPVNEDARIFIVFATGPWSIEITSR